MGFDTTASGVFSTAMGDNTEASGLQSTATGGFTTASELFNCYGFRNRLQVAVFQLLWVGILMLKILDFSVYWLLQ